MTADAAPILVFQMAKVASVSWYDAIGEAAPERERHHFHYASRISRDFIAEIRDQEGPLQTIAHRNMFRRLGLPSSQLAGLLRDGRWHGPRALIIAGIREPMARSMSVLQHGADFLGHKGLALTSREGGTAENLLQVFRAGWREALGDAHAEDTFGRFLGFAFGHYRTWFEDELHAAFGLDASGAKFDRESWTMRIDGPEHRALIYRVEDLSDATRLARVLAAASTFLGMDIAHLPVRNAAEGRRSRDLYKSFRDMAFLPRADIDRIYEPPILGRFYQPDELQSFKARWTQRG